jgi:hypothetical protein
MSATESAAGLAPEHTPTAEAELAPLSIRAGSTSDDVARDKFVRAHPRGTFFHLSGWRRVVERGAARRSSACCP